MISSTILRCAEMSASRRPLSAKERNKKNPARLSSHPLYISTSPIRIVLLTIALGRDQARRQPWSNRKRIPPDSLAGIVGEPGRIVKF